MRFKGIHLAKSFTSLSLAVSLFTDPSIVSKYLGLPPALYFFLVLVLVSYQIIFLLSRASFRIDLEVRFLGTSFLVYAFVSLAYRILVNQKLGDLSLHILLIFNFYFLFLLLRDVEWRDSFVQAIYLSGVANFVTLFPDPLGFRSNLISVTNYQLGEGGLDEFFRRETGLFPAPAMLVAFALVMCMVVMFNFAFTRTKNKLRTACLLVISLSLGLSTFNRGFVLGLIFLFLLLNWCYGFSVKALGFCVVLGIIAYLFPPEQYINFVGNRLNDILVLGFDSTQRLDGNAGILTGFEIFQDHPFWGHPVSPMKGTLQALGLQGQVVNPHNLLAQILSIYGLIGGSPILLLYSLAFHRTTRILFDRRSFSYQLKVLASPVHSQVFYAAISACLFPVLMLEPLGEYSFVFLLSLSSLMVGRQRS
jgi:hypothetical protein